MYCPKFQCIVPNFSVLHHITYCTTHQNNTAYKSPVYKVKLAISHSITLNPGARSGNLPPSKLFQCIIGWKTVSVHHRMNLESTSGLTDGLSSCETCELRVVMLQSIESCCEGIICCKIAAHFTNSSSQMTQVLYPRLEIWMRESSSQIEQDKIKDRYIIIFYLLHKEH